MSFLWVSGRSRGLAFNRPRFITAIRRTNLEFEGAVAQLGERLICIQEVAGSIPTSSTRLKHNAGL